MNNAKNKARSPILKIIIVIFVLGLVTGGIFYFRPGEREEKASQNLNISFHEAKGEEIGNIEEINQPSKLIFSERIVTGFNEKGDNIYQTNFYITDAKGEKKYKFYSTDDLTFEMAYPYLDNTIIILTEFGTAKNRVIDFNEGEKKDIFTPPIGFGPDFVFSEDKTKIAFVENESQADISSGFNFYYKYTLKVKNLEDGSLFEFNPEKIKHHEINFVLYLPVGFSSDNSLLYVFASQSGLEEIYQNPNGLYAINLKTEEIDEIYYSSIDEEEDKDLLVFLDIFPEHGFALVNRGPKVFKNEKTVFRTQLQKLELKTKEFTDIYVDEYIDQVDSLGKILSPDGQKVIFMNDAYYDKGLSLYNLEEKSKQKLTDKGEFKTWLNEGETIVYEQQIIEEKEEGSIGAKIELHTLNFATREDHKIYTQESIDEATGLNKEGDTFYSFIGSI